MNPFQTILILSAAFLAVFGETVLSMPRVWLGAQIDLLPAIMVFAALNAGLTTIRLLPPLVITKVQLDHLVKVLAEVLATEAPSSAE